MKKDTEREYPDNEVLLAAGRAAWDWVVDIGDCLFCNADSSRHIYHEECPFEKLNEGKKMKPLPVYPELAILTAGFRALEWYKETGECVFCDVDADNANDSGHQPNCTFFIPDLELDK